MYEPGERGTEYLKLLRENIQVLITGEDLLLVAENENNEIIGYIWAERGKLNRIQHTAYITTGIRERYRGKGIGTEFFKKLNEWARSKKIIRLELTVECENIHAKHLYEKNGFIVEGIRHKSMNVNGNLLDEYYMGKIIE